LGYHLIKCLCSSNIIYLALSPLKSWVINWVSKKQGQKKCNLRMCSTYFLQMNHDKCNTYVNISKIKPENYIIFKYIIFYVICYLLFLCRMTTLRICQAVSLNPGAPSPSSSRTCLMGCRGVKPNELRRFPVHDADRWVVQSPK